MGAVKTHLQNKAKPAAGGIRVNGKQWHKTKSAFRPTAGQRSYKARLEQEQTDKLAKQGLMEMKDDKDADRQARIQAIKDKQAKKAERERHALLEAKYSKKRAERMKRKAKRNAMLKP